MVLKYKKKPVEVEATCLNFSEFDKFKQDVNELIGTAKNNVKVFFGFEGYRKIVTVQNGSSFFEMDDGDYLVKGIDNSIYPVKGETFLQVYEVPDNNTIVW